MIPIGIRVKASGIEIISGDELVHRGGAARPQKVGQGYYLSGKLECCAKSPAQHIINLAKSAISSPVYVSFGMTIPNSDRVVMPFQYERGGSLVYGRRFFADRLPLDNEKTYLIREETPYSKHHLEVVEIEDRLLPTPEIREWHISVVPNCRGRAFTPEQIATAIELIKRLKEAGEKILARGMEDQMPQWAPQEWLRDLIGALTVAMGTTPYERTRELAREQANEFLRLLGVPYQVQGRKEKILVRQIDAYDINAGLEFAYVPKSNPKEQGTA